VTVFEETFNNQALREALNLLPLVRGYAYLREEKTKARMTCFYNYKVKERPLKEGDLALRKMEVTGEDPIKGQLTLNSEGLYIISKEVRK